MPFETPVLFVIFNRPETARIVFDQIKKVKPEKLYVVADGPRLNKNDDAQKCNQARKIIEEVDWDCTVIKNFRDTNFGCTRSVSSAVSWFFEKEEKGIILEDDCAVDESFFYFARELLEKYKDDNRIFSINATNFLPQNNFVTDSYYFSRVFHCWGWASWRRAWKYYDLEMKDLDDFVKQQVLKNYYKDKYIIKYWHGTLKNVQRNLDTWDFQAAFIPFKENMLCINPCVNLVSNIGFEENVDATHPISQDEDPRLIMRKINFPLIHPKFIVCNEKADLLETYSHRKIENLNVRIKKFFKRTFKIR